MIRRVLSFIFMLAVSSQVLAEGYVVGKVVGVRVDKSGIGLVVFDQPVGGTPASCRHPDYANALAFDTNTSGGRAIMTAAFAAKATGDTISAKGTGACNVFGGNWVEDWSFGTVQ